MHFKFYKCDSKIFTNFQKYTLTGLYLVAKLFKIIFDEYIEWSIVRPVTYSTFSYIIDYTEKLFYNTIEWNNMCIKIEYVVHEYAEWTWKNNK